MSGVATYGDNVNVYGTNLDNGSDNVLYINDEASALDGTVSDKTVTVKNVSSFSTIYVKKGGLAVSDTLSNNGTVYVGNNTATGSLSVNKLTGTGTIFTAPTWENSTEASTLAVTSRSTESSIVIGQNSVGILGSSTTIDQNNDLVTNALAAVDKTWGKGPDNIGAALVVTNSQAVTRKSALVVDSSLIALRHWIKTRLPLPKVPCLLPTTQQKQPSLYPQHPVVPLRTTV